MFARAGAGGQPFNIELFHRFVTYDEDEFAWHEERDNAACGVWEAWIDYHAGTEFSYDDDDPNHPLSVYCLRAVTTHGPALIEQAECTWLEPTCSIRTLSTASRR
eukprot:SAG22_NODE_158_length_16966_cov_26.252446_6_plen_105_part_00